MAGQVNLNADMGESFGIYRMGDDSALLKIVRSANIACGFHAGDPRTMHDLVAAAAAEGVSIGAHPGFDDVAGFGRRRIDMNLRELEYMVAYQIGALQAVASYAKSKVTHVKPHGALSNMAAEDAEIARAIGRAIKAVGPDMIYLAQAGTEMEKAAIDLGLPLAREGFCDRLYEDDGNLASRKIPGAVIHDPALIKERVVRMVLEDRIVSRHGKAIPCKIDSICVHGEEPGAVEIARAARAALEQAGVDVVALTEMGFA